MKDEKNDKKLNDPLEQQPAAAEELPDEITMTKEEFERVKAHIDGLKQENEKMVARLPSAFRRILIILESETPLSIWTALRRAEGTLSLVCCRLLIILNALLAMLKGLILTGWKDLCWFSAN